MHITAAKKEYLRSILFGIEDSLVSTCAFIAGVSVGSSNNHFIILSTIVAIFIEGVSMGVGEYVSDDAVEGLDKIKRHRDNPLLSGLLLCVSYLLAGMVPFLPIVFFPFPLSLVISAALALTGLFLLGFLKGKLLKVSPIRGGIKILIVGGVTTVLGIVIGLIFRF